MGRVVRGIGKAIGGVVKGVAKFASSPIGKALIGVGLSVFTGGAGGLLAGGLKGIMSSGIGKGLSGIVGNLAQKFLPNISSMLSGSGLGTVGNLLQSVVGGGQGSGGISDILSKLTQTFTQNANQTDPTTAAAGYENLQQMAAFFQAQALRNQQQAI